MENFEQRIANFERDAQELKAKRDFKDFAELETRFCNVLNEGIILKNHLKDNPMLCSEGTYRFLSNQTQDKSLLEDKYKFLVNILEIKTLLMEHYQKYVKFLVQQKKDFNMAIRVYNQMFTFTQNYFYKKEIANIYLIIFRDKKKCLEMYKEIEPHMSKSSHFWWEFSEVYWHYHDYFNQISCMQKAIELELERINK